MVNTPYVDAGATAYDLCAQASLTVTSNSTVNTSVPGTYTVTYSATTADGTPGTITRTVNVVSIPNFGPNVLIFDPTMTNIQSQVDVVFSQQQYNQFGPQRYALLFKPGQYNNLDIDMGFYTQVLGLGQCPTTSPSTGLSHPTEFRGWKRDREFLAVRRKPGRESDRRHDDLGRVAGHLASPPACPGRREPVG